MKNRIGNIFKIAYMPSLSAVMKAFIKQNVNPSMQDGDTAQYPVDFILEAIEDQKFDKEDLDLINYMVNEENIEYIEF